VANYVLDVFLDILREKKVEKISGEQGGQGTSPNERPPAAERNCEE
jgi:hypothetical protein